MVHLDSGIKSQLDAVDSNLSLFFSRQLEFIEPELHSVEYGELAAWKHIPIESRGGDNIWYTWRLFDKVGAWKIGGEDADDVPEVNINGAELPVPVRWLTGGFKNNLKELLNGLQAARNNPNAPSIMVDIQKAVADFESYQQKVDKVAWFADPSSSEYAGLTGIFYNTYIPTVTALLGPTSGKYGWFNSAGAPQKTADEMLTDLNQLLTAVMVNTLGRYKADTILLPIEYYNYLAFTRIQDVTGKTILRFFLEAHPEITTFEYAPVTKSVPAGGNLTSATDIILAYKKSPDVVKLVLPKQHTMLPVQLRGFNYITPCYATTAGVITQKPNAMCMLKGCGLGGVTASNT
jgi:hypothetical protein